MTHEERAIHMIEKLKDKIEKCQPMSTVFIVQTSEFIQDSYNDKEINKNVFNELRNRLKSVANSFPLNCSCIPKERLID